MTDEQHEEEEIVEKDQSEGDLSDFGFPAGSTVSGNKITLVDECDEVMCEEEAPASKLAANARMWAQSGTDYFPCEQAVPQLKPGQYTINSSNSRGVYFTSSTINLDELIALPDNNSEKVIAGIKNFWEREDNFREFGFLWKRGVMLYGPPGSGKTSTVQQLSKLIVDMGGISVYCTCPRIDAEGLRILRNIEPNRPIVVIMEDIDAIISRYGESDLLAMLDGELQVDNVVFVATTNYPERLDKRFVNRPSRFDEVTYIGMPSLECRKVFISAKNKSLSEDELNVWAAQTDGMSIAHLRELIVSVECLGNTFESSIARLKKMMEQDLCSSKAEKGAFGFAVKVDA